MIRISAFSDEASEDLTGQIAALKRNGLSLTDVRGINGVNIGAMDVRDAREHARRLAGEGIGVWCIGSPIGKCPVTDEEKNIKDGLSKIANLAHVFGCDKIRIFSFFDAYNDGQRVCDLLSGLVSDAEKEGVTLYLENEKGVYGDTVERVRYILSRVKGLKSIYDPANYVQVGENAAEAYDLVGRNADFWHIKDVVAQTGEIVPAGMGDGHIESVIDGVKGDAVFTLEPHLMEFVGYGGIDDTVLKNRFTFDSNADAFDCACRTLKALIESRGYAPEGGGFVKK